MANLDNFFDDVVVNVKAAATAVSKKANDVYGTSKQKISAAEMRSEINSKLRELGALTYKSVIHDIDVSEQSEQLISEIKELKDNLKVINEHIASAKNQKKCPQCGSVLAKNSIYCNICGTKLAQEEQEEQEDNADENQTETVEPVQENEDINTDDNTSEDNQ